MSDYIFRPCRDLYRELKFHKALEEKEGVSSKDSLYKKAELDTLVERTGSPIEIVIKVKPIMFGSLDFF